MRRSIIAGAIILAVLVGGGAGLAVFRPWEAQQAGSVSIGGPFTLTDQDGRAVSDQSFRGKWMLVYFGYTHCPDACPTALNAMAEALDQIGAARAGIQPIFITLDPERDTPAVLKDYTGAFDAGILGLTGTPEQIATAAREYRIAYAKHLGDAPDDYEIDHSSIIFLMNPAGRLAAFFSHETPPDRMARRIREALG